MDNKPLTLTLITTLAIILTGCTSQVSQPFDYANQEQSLLILINDKRLDLELPALITTTVLMQVAEAHSQDMAANNYLAHASLTGLHGDDRLTEAGYDFSYWGEAIAGGSTTPAVALDGWLNSPPHKAVLLDGRYQEIGLGFAYGGETEYGYYWVVMVTRPGDE